MSALRVVLKSQRQRQFVWVSREDWASGSESVCIHYSKAKVGKCSKYRAKRSNLALMDIMHANSARVPPPARRSRKRSASDMQSSSSTNRSNIVCYTDGSTIGNPGPTGAACVVLLPSSHSRTDPVEMKEALGDPFTNNIGELWAFWFVLRVLSETWMSDVNNNCHDFSKKVVIYSDSTYAINAVNGKNKAKANPELIGWLKKEMKLFEERFNVEVHLDKVKAHSGIVHNERADKLAKEAAAECVSLKTPVRPKMRPLTQWSNDPSHPNYHYSHRSSATVSHSSAASSSNAPAVFAVDLNSSVNDSSVQQPLHKKRRISGESLFDESSASAEILPQAMRKEGEVSPEPGAMQSAAGISHMADAMPPATVCMGAGVPLPLAPMRVDVASVSPMGSCVECHCLAKTFSSCGHVCYCAKCAAKETILRKTVAQCPLCGGSL